jgi:hypothetical protein
MMYPIVEVFTSTINNLQSSINNQSARFFDLRLLIADC